MEKKDREISHSLSFSVGANCVRPRAFTERPYKFNFLSAGKICFMEGTLSGLFLFESFSDEGDAAEIIGILSDYIIDIGIDHFSRHYISHRV